MKRHAPARAAQFLYALLPLLLIALACFPLVKIKANSIVTLVSAGPKGKPFVNVSTAHRLELTYTGDAKAIAAVKQWKFQPAMKDGHPVNVQISVEVGFRLF